RGLHAHPNLSGQTYGPAPRADFGSIALASLRLAWGEHVPDLDQLDRVWLPVLITENDMPTDSGRAARGRCHPGAAHARHPVLGTTRTRRRSTGDGLHVLEPDRQLRMGQLPAPASASTASTPPETRSSHARRQMASTSAGR